jgi:hypothetical protein
VITMSSRLPRRFLRLCPVPAAARAFSAHASFSSAAAEMLAQHAGTVKVLNVRPVLSVPLHDLVGDPDQAGRVRGQCGVKPIASRPLKQGEVSSPPPPCLVQQYARHHPRYVYAPSLRARSLSRSHTMRALRCAFKSRAWCSQSPRCTRCR